MATLRERGGGGVVVVVVVAEDNDDPWAASVGEGGHSTSLADKSDSDSSSNLSLSNQHVPDEDRDPFAAPSPSSSSSVDLPVIYQILQSLVKQISLLRTQVPQFDRLLSERRQGLLFADHLNEAMNIMLDVDQTAASSVFGSPAKSGSSLLMTKRKGRGSAALGLGLGSGLAGSIKSFLTPKKKGGGHHTSEMSGTPDEPGSTTPRLGFGLGFPGFSSTTPTKSPSPLPLPTPPVASASASASAPGSGTGMNLNLSSPSLSSAEPTPFKAHYDQTRQPVSLPLYFERGEEKEEGEDSGGSVGREEDEDGGVERSGQASRIDRSERCTRGRRGRRRCVVFLFDGS